MREAILDLIESWKKEEERQRKAMRGMSFEDKQETQAWIGGMQGCRRGLEKLLYTDKQ